MLHELQLPLQPGRLEWELLWWPALAQALLAPEAVEEGPSPVDLLCRWKGGREFPKVGDSCEVEIGAGSCPPGATTLIENGTSRLVAKCCRSQEPL